jgi:hypothetical protein
MEWMRFSVFFVISLLVVLIASTVGLIIGACFNVIVSISLVAEIRRDDSFLVTNLYLNVFDQI